MVGKAYKGKNFDPQDKARFDQVLSGYDKRTDVSPEQKASVKVIAAESRDSEGGGINRSARPTGPTSSDDWAIGSGTFQAASMA
jgi:hypothetical protein